MSRTRWVHRLLHVVLASLVALVVPATPRALAEPLTPGPHGVAKPSTGHDEDDGADDTASSEDQADQADPTQATGKLPSPAPWPEVPAGTRVVVSRPSGCGVAERIRFSPRRVRKCAGERRVALTVQADHTVQVEELQNVPPRMPQVPVELAEQWRICPWKSVAAFEVAGTPWIPYEDPQVGRCYLWRPFDATAWARIADKVHAAKMQETHPYLASVIAEMAVRAAAQGIEIHVLGSVSGMAIHRDKHKATKKHKRASAKKKSRGHRGGRFAYMHPWGLAVDLTIGWKKPLLYPDKFYHPGTEVYKIFRQLGAWAQEMGVVWLGASMRGELAHFEFHPTTWGTVDGPDLARMLQLYRQGGVRKSHEFFKYQGDAGSPFLGMRDAGPFP